MEEVWIVAPMTLSQFSFGGGSEPKSLCLSSGFQRNYLFLFVWGSRNQSLTQTQHQQRQNKSCQFYIYYYRNLEKTGKFTYLMVLKFFKLCVIWYRRAGEPMWHREGRAREKMERGPSWQSSHAVLPILYTAYIHKAGDLMTQFKHQLDTKCTDTIIAAIKFQQGL